MKFQFNPNQKYQLDAISAVTELFAGHNFSESLFGIETSKIGSIQTLSSEMGGHPSGYGNNLTLTIPIVFEFSCFFVQSSPGRRNSPRKRGSHSGKNFQIRLVYK